MASQTRKIDAALVALDGQISEVAGGLVAAAIERHRADFAALRFHLRDAGDRPMIVAILGGTGTGKSTIVNRLLGADVSAASFRRTFTAGVIAIVDQTRRLPDDWLGLPHATAEALPARGEADRLVVVEHANELTRSVVLADTPDLDGDQPLHHAQADRAFRWADAVVLLVTPEKYQMTELVPYYRLVRRWNVPALFAMNKTEQGEAVEDYQTRLADSNFKPRVFAIPRDDANFEPAAQINLNALRNAIASLARPEAETRDQGLRRRCADLVGRFVDQVLTPLTEQRKQADRAMAMLAAMEAPPTEIDVNPITKGLARRLQQRSILYLIGPGRVLDRVRQVPGLLARLPRTAWDLIMRGKADFGTREAEGIDLNAAPDFPAILGEQFSVLQSRIDDVIRSSGAGTGWIESDDAGYRSARIDPQRACAIATEELEALKSWLETRWNATPRDTALLQKLLKQIPGAQKLTQWSEAAPYLLAIVVATHHAFFGHIDLMILGGYSLATWLTERLSNEVASRTRQANRAIADRCEKLAHEQIRTMSQWLNRRAPTTQQLAKMRASVESIMELCGEGS